MRLYTSLFAALYLISVSHVLAGDDESLDHQRLSVQQTKYAAEYFSNKQVELLKDVLQLEQALHEKNNQTVIKLGEARVAEIKEALQMPESNYFERTKKEGRLQKLKYDEFKALDFNSPEDKVKIGELIFYERTIKGEKLEEFQVVIPGLGKAKPTSIDRRVIFKISHEKSRIIFLKLDSEIDFDSDHLNQFISRLNIQDDPVVLLAEHYTDIGEDTESQLLRYKYYPVPKNPAHKISTWWRANYVAPDAGAVVTTAMSVLFQVTTTEGISFTNYTLGNSQTWDHTSTYLTAGFGVVFGLWGSFYTNVTAPRDPLDPVSRRNALVRRIIISSASFAYSLQILSHGIHSLSLATSGGWLNHLRLLGNTVLNNSIKDKWKMINDIRDDMGVSRGQLNAAGVKVKKTQVERNVIDQGPRVLKMVDLMHLDVMGIPVGSILFYSSYFWTQGLIVKYAEKVNYKHKALLRERWEKFKSNNYRIIREPHLVVIENSKKVYKWISEQRNDLIALFRRSFASGIFGPNRCSKKIEKTEDDFKNEIIPFTPISGDTWLDLPSQN